MASPSLSAFLRAFLRVGSSFSSSSVSGFAFEQFAISRAHTCQCIPDKRSNPLMRKIQQQRTAQLLTTAISFLAYPLFS